MGMMKILGAAAEIGFGSICGLAVCAARTAEDCGKAAASAIEGNWREAGEIVANRALMPLKAAVATVGTTAELAGEAISCMSDSRKDFLTDENIRRMTNLTSVGLAVCLGDACLGESGPDYPDEPNSPFLTDSGKFDGSPANMQALIAQGEIEGTEHVDASDIHRSLAARNEFLAAHGYDQVPEGYEVHHVVPLSEGGTDTPDNMILLTEEEHDAVTAAHRRFYGWNA